MTRISLPNDVEELITQISPYIATNVSAIDAIRIALFRMKEDFILNNKNIISVDNPNHPFYAKLSQKEIDEVALAKAEKTAKKGDAKTITKWLK